MHSAYSKSPAEDARVASAVDRLINPPLVVDPGGRPVGRCDRCRANFYALPVTGDEWTHQAPPKGYRSPVEPHLDDDGDEIIPQCDGTIRRLDAIDALIDAKLEVYFAKAELGIKRK